MIRTLTTALSLALLASRLLAAPTSSATADICVPADFPSIQLAINAAQNGDEIFVDAGVYFGSLDFTGKDITLVGAGPTCTTIVGTTQTSVVRFISGETRAARISGFTISGGNAVSGIFPLVNPGNGGGILCEGSSPTITGNIITDNQAEGYGGGIACIAGAAPLIENNEISHNISFQGGGGVACRDGSDAEIRLNDIAGNGFHNVQFKAPPPSFGGGGILCMDSSPFVFRNDIRSNSFLSQGALGSQGGGIALLDGGNAGVVANIVHDNFDVSVGGGVYTIESAPVFQSNMIYQNSAGVTGAGVYVAAGNPVGFPVFDHTTIADNNTVAFNGVGGFVAMAPAALFNSVVWNNTSGSLPVPPVTNLGGNLLAIDAQVCALDDLTGLVPNQGNVVITDPLFIDPGMDDYHLQHQSPCRGLAKPMSYSQTPVTQDYELDRRFTAEDPAYPSHPVTGQPSADIGADEFFPHTYFQGVNRDIVALAPGETGFIGVIGHPMSPALPWVLAGNVNDPVVLGPLPPIFLNGTPWVIYPPNGMQVPPAVAMPPGGFAVLPTAGLGVGDFIWLQIVLDQTSPAKTLATNALLLAVPDCLTPAP